MDILWPDLVSPYSNISCFLLSPDTAFSPYSNSPYEYTPASPLSLTQLPHPHFPDLVILCLAPVYKTRDSCMFSMFEYRLRIHLASSTWHSCESLRHSTSSTSDCRAKLPPYRNIVRLWLLSLTSMLSSLRLNLRHLNPDLVTPDPDFHIFAHVVLEILGLLEKVGAMHELKPMPNTRTNIPHRVSTWH